jgi:hypothetical protein
MKWFDKAVDRIIDSKHPYLWGYLFSVGLSCCIAIPLSLLLNYLLGLL